MSGGKNAPVRDRPTVAQLEAELARTKYRARYRTVLRSTVYTLVIVAAAAVLVATLWLPVLQIYGNSMTPTLTDGDIVVSVKQSDFAQGDVVAFYRLTETTTPDGYNTIAPIEFTITAEHDVLSDSPALTSLSGDVTTGEITFAANATDGSLSADVINNAGATLPETGGMGTTIFYVLGGVLMLGAVVLLVTKKRMNAE